MTKNASSDEKAISKRHDTTLWREIRTLYESKTQPSYDKIKDILCAEFNLEDFPAQRTMQRRAKNEGWQRYTDDKAVKTSPSKYSDEFWLCVRRVYESNGKMTYKRLKETVENELQCTDFPSQPVVAAKANAEDWKRSENLLKQSDASLKKLSKGVTRITSFEDLCDFMSGIDPDVIQEYKESRGWEDPTEPIDFDVLEAMLDDEKAGFKNLLMTSQVRRKKLADVIVKSRKRMALNNDLGDSISDALVAMFAMVMSNKVRRYASKGMMKELKERLNALSQISEIYNGISYNKRENLKFELSLYGVQTEDLKDVDDTKRVADMNDDKAYEEQRERLRLERENIAARRRYIDSGGLAADVEEEVQRRMLEANADDEIEDAEFSEVE